MIRLSAPSRIAPLVIALSLAIASPTLSAQTSAGATRIQLDIKPQSLSSAVNKVAQTARLQLAAPPELLAGKTAPALSGSFTAEEALQRLLAGSGIQYRFIDGNTVALQPAPAAAPARQGGNPQSRSSEPTELDGVNVTGRAFKPDYAINADVTRTRDDAQAYYFFANEQLQTSGASNVEEFLKQRLSMNAASSSFSQVSGSGRGNASNFNLRGLGADKTLVLVNGRRVAGATTFDETYQADLNGIPISAVDHIEVLPSSASAIYGSAALGGVINIILKKNYSGGEVTVSYENPQDSDAAIQQIQAMFGKSFQDGRSHLMLSVVKKDANSLLTRDRYSEIDANYRRIEANSPGFLYSTTNPWLGSTPNIGSTDGSNLVLRDGTSLGAPITHISAGTSPSTPAASLAAMLLANAGAYNLDYTPSSSARGGLMRPLQKESDDVSVMGSFRTELTDRVQVFMDVSHSNSRTYDFASANAVYTVSADAPSNPFNQAVRVTIPTQSVDYEIYTKNRNIVVGTAIDLPKEWTLSADYTYTAADYIASTRYNAAWLMNAAIADGVFNPFVDTLAHDQDYLSIGTYGYDRGSKMRRTTTREFAARVNGSVLELPAGPLMIAGAISHRTVTAGSGQENYSWLNGDGTSSFESYNFIPSGQQIDSAYVEAKIPLLRSERLFAKELELQLALRTERYSQDLGSYAFYTYDEGDYHYSEWYPGDADGNRVYGKTTWNSTDPTIGLKWRPSSTLMLRASYAEAFVPQGPWYLQPDPFREGDASVQVTDPLNGQSYFVGAWTGGDPNNAPSSAKTWNFGLVWEPTAVLKGLRVGIEHYRIDEDGSIGQIPAQEIVDGENGQYADRVHRDPDTGLISWIDQRYTNLFARQTRGYDLTLGYRLATEERGTFSVDFMGTYIDSLKRQIAFDGPMLEYVGFINQGGALKVRGSLALSWAYRNWNASWTARYFHSYNVAYSEGSPGGVLTTYTAAQGSNKVPSQTYHDLMTSYDFDGSERPLLEGVSLQFGIKNIFDKVPPLDVTGCSGYYSCFGDMRLRTFYLALRKQF